MILKRVSAALLLISFATILAAADESSAPQESRGLVTMRGKHLILLGTPLHVGDPAPSFMAVANNMSNYNFQPTSGKVWIVASVPSLDTKVCSSETHHFNEEASQLGSDVQILTVSMDLPFAQRRWCDSEIALNLQTVSDYRDHQFGLRYGVLIKETGLLARTVFVLDREGKIVYIQIVPELTNEPDYAPVLAAARQAAGINPTTQPTAAQQ